MPEIVPAIIAKDFEELKSKIRFVEPYVNWVQLDVMDEKFAPETTWNDPGELKNLDASVNMEAHLMIEEPEKTIDKWLDSGVKRILIHVESTSKAKISALIKKIRDAGLEAGVVLNLGTPVDTLEMLHVTYYMLHVIQLMSIAQIGYHGHPFDEKVIHKIKALRKKYPDVKIAVDGGINEDTAPKAVEAGADILVAGSAIFDSENVGSAIKRLEKIYV